MSPIRTPLRSALAAAGLAAAFLLTAGFELRWSAPVQAQDGWRSDRDMKREPVEPRNQPRPNEPLPPRRSDQPKDGQPKDGRSAKAPPEPKPIPKSMRKPGASAVPEGAGERAQLLDELYAHLATAEDEAVAKRITTAIEHVWMTTGSDTVGLLMERSRRAVRDKNPELAVRLLDRAVALAPDYAEVFNQRAAVHYLRNNTRLAVGDLRRVLALDPNHYKALEALGQLFKEMDRKKAALEVYRKLYEVHPHMSGVKSTLDELSREVEGQPT
jgi:tetratricopeptide (TPR) repeat protein